MKMQERLPEKTKAVANFHKICKNGDRETVGGRYG